jgi:alpha-L-arabinofuranosidase
MTVNVGKPGATISPNFYGLMTEEINHAYDGGLYGELIQNRSFRDDDSKPVHWSLVQGDGATGSMSLDKTGAVNPALNASLKLESTTQGARVGVANDGFWGVPVRPRTTYKASFYARSTSSGPLTIGIESNDGKTIFAQAQVKGITPQWKKYEVTLRTAGVKPSLDNRLVVSTRQSGTTWLSFVSLFPPTFKNRVNGNRIDLVEKMIDMKPTFLRFPGGNYVDPGHYEWKKTIGPVEQRPLGRREWGYPSSYGLGIMEFLLWCEEMKIEPVLAVTDGRPWLPADGDVSPLVQDALDEIEYVSGAASTPWGAKRARDGHPAPFKLRYVEIGNEDFFDRLPTYDARFAKFFDAIRAKYPALQIIATRGDVSSRRPDIVDDHIYASVANMLKASHNYDNYDRSKPKIFVGEWATTVGSPTPILKAALSDAAYLMGLERNADVVVMSCYAPLFVNVNPGARQWGTNLIGYDALQSYGSPSYYMQSMFSANKGDVVLPVQLSGSEKVAPAPMPRGSVGVGTWETQAEFKDAQVTSGTQTLPLPEIGAWKKGQGTWKAQDSTLVQSGNQQLTLASAGAPDWTDYTYSVKARKTGGAEGFLIFFHVQDNDNLVLWNVGGWNNTRSALQSQTNGERNEFGNTDTKVETGRWYDVRIEVKGRQIRAFLDNKLIVQANDEPATPGQSIYGSASRDMKTGDIILKVVNLSDAPQSIQIDLQGAPRIKPSASGMVLSGQPNDVNSIEEPTKVAPKKLTFANAASNFNREFPANSVSVIRIGTAK